MARSNGTQDRTAAPPARPQRPAQPVDHGLPWNTGAGQGGEPPYGQPYPQDNGQPYNGQAYHGQHPGGQLPWPPQGQPTAPPPQHYAQQAAYQQQTAGQGYPQHAGYPPEPQLPHYQAAPGHPPMAADYGQQGYAAAPVYQEAAPPLRGSYAQTEPSFAPPYAHPPTLGGAPAPQDPRGYDFGAYVTPQPGYVDPATGRGHPPPPQGYHAAYGSPQPGQAAYHPAHADQAAGQQAAPGEGDYDDDDYEDEEVDPPRRFGWLKAISAVTVAIAVGFGGAYGVKKYGGSVFGGSAKPIVVRADATPSKTRPVGSEGDAKAGERLTESLPAVVPAGDGTGDGGAPAGARRVQTIAITPNGAAPAPSAIRPTLSMPGLVIESQPTAPVAAGLPPVTPAPIGRAVAPAPVAAALARAPVTPRVIASVEEAAPAPVAKAPVQRVAAAQPPKVAKSADAYSPSQGVGAATVATATAAPAAVVPAPAPKAASNGYVAVLASQSSAIDARKMMDTLQGQFSTVIGDKPTDVTEFANPRDGKTYYRAIVGPPGSREAANSVCAQMKAAGHKDCFAVPY